MNKSVSSVEQLLELLEAGVRRITDSKEYRQALDLMRRFPSYSIRNTVLIFQQMPQATFVAGYQKWKKDFGRQVKKGEKGIRILAPCTYTQRIEENGIVREEKYTGFRTISVFDISQTEGKPLPQGVQPVELQGDCPDFDTARDCIEQLTGYSVIVCDPEDGTVNGQCSYREKTISLSERLEKKQAFKTLLHESAHALLHEGLDVPADDYALLLAQSQPLREVEAESVSFIVCKALGIDSDDYSFPYIAHWQKNERFLPQSLERIANTSRMLIEMLSKWLEKKDPEAGSSVDTEITASVQTPRPVLSTAAVRE